MSDGVRIRPARPTDLAALNDLYNHYVKSSPVKILLESDDIDVQSLQENE